MSTIYQELKIKINMLKESYKIKNVFGKDKLFQFELNNNMNNFSFSNLQIISGKEYTYVFEVELPDIIQMNENIFEVEFIADNNETFKEFCKYKVVGGAFSISDEEYLKNRLYDTLNEAMELKEQKKTEQMNILLNGMKDWIEKNYEGINKKDYLKKLNEALGLFKDDYTFQRYGRSRITADIYENQLRKGKMYSNKLQVNMVSSSSPYH